MKTLASRATIVVLFLLFTLSCSKIDQRTFLENSRSFGLLKSVPGSNSSGGANWVASIPVPSTFSAQEIFSNDKYILENILLSQNQDSASLYMYDLANRVSGYFYHIRGIDLRNDFVGDPSGIIILGLFYAAEENYYLQQGMLAINANRTILEKKKGDLSPLKYDDGDRFSCFITAVSTLIGISDARNLWRSILGGAAEQTIISGLKLMARRTFFAITIATTVYSVGDCLDWW